MAYQPPLIGFKQLLNFGAYSMPDIGGWIFIGAGLILLYCVIREFKKKVKINKTLAILLMGGLISSCNTGPEPFKFGKDNCHFCKMTISDARFGAEIVTTKGKIYKFDDVKCMQGFIDQDKSIKLKKSKIFI